MKYLWSLPVVLMLALLAGAQGHNATDVSVEYLKGSVTAVDEPVEPPPPPKSRLTVEPAVTRMAHGWCYGEEDSVKAAAAAVARLKQDLQGQHPSVIFFTATTIGLDLPQMLGVVSGEFPDTPIWGATSALGVFMNNEHDYMKGSVIGLTALCSPHYDVVVAGDSVGGRSGNHAQAAERAIAKARGRYPDKTPSLILFTADPGPHEEGVIEQLKEAFGRKVPIFGGSCGTEAPNPRYAVANDKGYDKGLSLCFIYTAKAIGYCYQMGYKREDVTGIATAVDGRWLKTIDGRPALEVYSEWTQGVIAEIVKDGQPIRGEGQMYHPLAVIKKAGGGRELVIALSAKGHSPETGAIEFFACVDKGDVLTVLRGDTESLIRRAYLGVARAKRMAGGRIAGGLVFYCSGARLLLEKQHLTQTMSPQLKQAFADKPFLLMFHNGEHGCIPGSESFHGNLMLDAVVFGE